MQSWHRAVAALLIVSLIGTSACTSLRPVPLTTAPTQAPAVKVGDHVVITQKNGEKRDFKVTAVETDALLGPDLRVSYEDIALLEVRRADTGRTVMLGLAIVGGVLVYAAVQALEFFGGLN